MPTIPVIAQWVGLLLGPLFVLAAYIHWNDRKITAIPPSVLYFSPKRCTPEDVQATKERLASSSPLAEKEVLPPKTGRRYIIVGGGGFLGGWIATKLIQRGEDIRHIRLLDLNPPKNHQLLLRAITQGLEFIKVDVTDPVSLKAAFEAPWQDSTSKNAELTVFNTVANIRFYERHLPFLNRSARVNVQGTQNILEAARAAGASVFIYTSSGSVGIHSTRFLLWPWEKEPEKFVQVVNDDESRIPTHHDGFFSNYAATKYQGEQLVRQADKSVIPSTGKKSDSRVMRTGCLRPGNGIFGPRGDMLCGAYLVRKTNPSWIQTSVQSFIYVENCAVAHLNYEERLIESLTGAHPDHPDIGGQAFCICDPGPTPTYGDAYTTLETLSEGECHFPRLSPTFMLLFAHVLQAYYRAHDALLASGFTVLIARMLPEIKGDIVNLQPALFYLTSPHLIFDDSRARLPPSKGGLGYTGVWTTIEGLHKTHQEHIDGSGRSETRSDTAGVSFGFGFSLRRSKKTTASKVADTLVNLPPVPVEVSCTN